jgi:cytochrome c-type biogenesis protein CcmH
LNEFGAHSGHREVLGITGNISLWLLGALFLIVLAGPSAVAAQTPGDALEKEAQNIDRMIMCPVCPAETIDQAQVEISFQMRAVVREMLAEGKTREEVLDYFVDRYGPDILAAPPKSGVNLLAWILPVVGVAAGLGGVFLVIRAMTGRGGGASSLGADSARRHSAGSTAEAVGVAATSGTPPDDPELAPYLEIADRLLTSRRSMGSAVAWPDGFPGEQIHGSGAPSHLDTNLCDAEGPPPDGEGPSEGRRRSEGEEA